ncbi:MAG: alpha/beta hydrolase [bacterium]|jgi:pimeloyl-ACP methyl ester carboxylesterase|nr:alpha/beta hydrolase [bacterium]
MRIQPGILILLVVWLIPMGWGDEFVGEKSLWNGYPHYRFWYDDRPCQVVVPHQPAEGKPWIWRARFWGHRPEVDLVLLEKGFYLVYIDVANLYGSPRAVAHWDAFYRFLTVEKGFAPKAVLEGMSRGGLIVYNWAKKNPEKVVCIYADAPVCDIRSWPGGKSEGQGSPEDWARCLAAYGLTEEEASQFRGNPIDGLALLAQTKVPLLHVCGDADPIVPIHENTRVLEKRYTEAGGPIQVLVKPGVGHVHGLDDPTPIVDFILNALAGNQ